MAYIINLTQHAATPEQVEQGVVDLKGDRLSMLKQLLTFEECPSMREVKANAFVIASLAQVMNLERIKNAFEHSYNLGSNGSPDTFIHEERALFNVADFMQCYAMIGGAPFLMQPLHNELQQFGITPVYAFSERVSVEHTAEDGSVHKSSVFKHIGFVGM